MVMTVGKWLALAALVCALLSFVPAVTGAPLLVVAVILLAVAFLVG